MVDGISREGPCSQGFPFESLRVDQVSDVTCEFTLITLVNVLPGWTVGRSQDMGEGGVQVRLPWVVRFVLRHAGFAEHTSDVHPLLVGQTDITETPSLKFHLFFFPATTPVGPVSSSPSLPPTKPTLLRVPDVARPS